MKGKDMRTRTLVRFLGLNAIYVFFHNTICLAGAAGPELGATGSITAIAIIAGIFLIFTNRVSSQD